MGTTDTGGVNGLVIAARIQEFIHQLSSDLTKDERNIQRDAREAELREGLEAAREMRDKADLVETGAILGGAFTIGGAAGQFGAATEFCTSVSDVPHPGCDAPVKELDAINGAAGAKVQAFGSLGSSGNLISQGFNGAGDREEALSLAF